MMALKRFIRFYRKHLAQSTINLFGLAFGMGVFLTIQLYIFNERDYDKFWESSDSIYRVSARWNTPEGLVSKAPVPPPIAPVLREYSSVEAATRLVYWSDFTMRPDTDSTRVFRETNIYQADEGFFEVFSDRLLIGNPEKALSDMFSVLLTERTAKKYFGDMPYTRIVGRNILGGKDGGSPWKITGILKDVPENSHIEYDMIIPMWDEFADSQIWSWHIMHTYVRMSGSEDDLAELLTEVVDDRILPHYIQEGITQAETNSGEYRLIGLPIGSIHLSPDWEDSIRGSNREAYLDILNYVSLLVFVLACINFINISTSLSFYRTSEIGIRKIHGSSTFRLFLLVLSEYMIYAVVALMFGLGINELFLIGLDRYFNIQLHVTPLDIPGFVGRVSLLTLLLSLLAASYPTYLLIRGKTARVTRGEWRIGKNRMLRDGLIVFQFFIAVFLIGFSLTIQRQIDFMQQLNIGFDRENLLVIQNDREIEEERSAFVDEVSRLTNVKSATFATSLPAMTRYQTRDATVPGSNENFPVQWYEVDENFVSTLGLEIVAGKDFAGMPSDSGKVLINEEAANLLDVESVLGSTLVINEGAQDERRVEIAGIVKSFNHEGFRSEVEPLVLEYLDNFTFKDYIAIRFSGDPSEAASRIEEVWSVFEPEIPITYSFLQSDFQRLFSSEIMLSRVFAFFSFLSLVIASLGLFGVSSVAMEQQTREMGIRKVFGASGIQLIIHQLKRFVWLVVLGLVIALPVSYLFSVEWLQAFAFRTSLNPWLFIISAASVLAITILIVGMRSWYGTLQKPIDSLRTE